MKHIVIAGGGFAGIRLARKLRKQTDIIVTLVNDSEDFRYSPALYRAVTGFKMGIARLPIEWMLIDSSNVNLVIGRVEGINEDSKQLLLEDGQKIDYDEVVFALGAVNTFFGISGLEEYSYNVRTFREALELKQNIHDNLVGASRATDENFVIVGAGPTGVELAGALGTYLLKIAKKHKMRHQHIKICLVEAGPRILPQMNEKASRKAKSRLDQLGVEVLTNTAVKSETLNELRTSVGMIKSKNVIWAAGTQNNPFFSDNPGVFKLNDRGRVVVNEHLQASSHIYVCGDNAATKYSGLAETAIWHANFVAKDIVARVDHKSRPKRFERLPMQVVPVGHKWAIFQYGPLVFGGRFASLVRRLADIIGYNDVLGPVKALTIWSNSDKTEESCPTCGVR